MLHVLGNYVEVGAEPGGGITFDPQDLGPGYGCPAGTCATLEGGVPKCKHPGGGMTDVIVGGPVRTPCGPSFASYLPWILGAGVLLIGGAWIFAGARGQRRDLRSLLGFKRRRSRRRSRPRARTAYARKSMRRAMARRVGR
jgi:hypothetical protein